MKHAATAQRVCNKGVCREYVWGYQPHLCFSLLPGSVTGACLQDESPTPHPSPYWVLILGVGLLK